MITYGIDRSFFSSGEHSFNVGVPQGSCLGPILCLVAINILLRRAVKDEAWLLQAFADDIFVATRSMAVMRFADILNAVLNLIPQWAPKFSLEFSYAKCNYTVVPRTGMLEYAPSRPILINGQRIRFQSRLVYLGVTNDQNLNWIPHLNAVQERAFEFLHKMDLSLRLTGESNRSCVRCSTK